MNNIKNQIIFIFKNSIIALVAGAIGIIGIAILKLLAIGTMKLTGESGGQLFLLNGLEIIQIGWTLGVALIFAGNSLWRLIISLKKLKILDMANFNL